MVFYTYQLEVGMFMLRIMILPRAEWIGIVATSTSLFFVYTHAGGDALTVRYTKATEKVFQSFNISFFYLIFLYGPDPSQYRVGCRLDGVISRTVANHAFTASCTQLSKLSISLRSDLAVTRLLNEKSRRQW